MSARTRARTAAGRLAAVLVAVLALAMLMPSASSTPMSASVASAHVVGPADWPQYMRGSLHLGVNEVEDTLTPQTVPRLKPAWSRSIEPSRYPASPIVVGDALFLGGTTLTKRKASTGAVVWSRTVSGAGPILTTPAYGNGIVVVTTYDLRSTVVAFDATTGAELWRRKLNGSAAGSPTIAGGLVYVGLDSSLVALRLASGSVKWRWDSGNTGYGFVSSPTTDGNGVYVSLAGGTHVAGLDAVTGQVRWERRLDEGNGWTLDGLTVALMAGQLYAGNVAGFLYRLDAATGATVWRQDMGGAVWRSLSATPQAILVLLPTSDDTINRLVAVRPSDGGQLWTYTPDPLGTVSPGISVAAGVVYLGWSNYTRSRLDVLSLGTGGRLARVPLAGSPEPRPPTISGGRVYLVGEQLQALEAALGRTGVRGALEPTAVDDLRPMVQPVRGPMTPVQRR